MRHATTGILVLVGLAGCKEPGAGKPSPLPASHAGVDASGTEEPASASPEPEQATAPAPAPEAGVQADVVEHHGEATVTWPSVVWTGQEPIVVWIEVEPRPPESERDAWGCLETDVQTNGIDLDQMESYTVWMATLDPATGSLGDPVALDGAGAGPKALSGPIFAKPVWWDGSVVMAWTLWNENAEPPPPARMVVGLWKPDGTPASEPLVIAKDRHWHLDLYDWVDLYLVSGSSLWLAWASNRPASVTGCHDDCGDMDSIAISEVSSPDPHDIVYECGDALGSISVHRFGEGFLMRQDNMHVSYHTWLSCIDARCGGSWYESETGVVDMLVTGGGAAAWYDEIVGDEVRGHCVDVWEPDEGQLVECARPRSRRIEWRDEGLVIVVETKKGDEYLLPYRPGDRIHLDLLRPVLEKKVPVREAVWTGSSIVAVWSRGKQVKVKLIGPAGVVSADG